MSIRTAAPDELDVPTLYRILALRSVVFVVEQNSVYPDMDGRDLEAATRHCWVEGEGGEVLSYLRVLDNPEGGSQIGRVVTAPNARGKGLAARLMRHALGMAARPVLLYSQIHLQEWYERFGFEVTGPPFAFDDDEGRIVHVPMVFR